MDAVLDILVLRLFDAALLQSSSSSLSISKRNKDDQPRHNPFPLLNSGSLTLVTFRSSCL